MTTNNKHYERLVSILYTLDDQNLQNVEDLKLPRNKHLWDELILATQDYVNYVALMSKTSKNKEGDLVWGNKDKIEYLVEKGYSDLYDIRIDIVCHIMKKMPLVLRQTPVEKKVFYIYKTATHQVYNMLRKLCPGEILPIDVPIASDKNDDGVTLADILPDTTYDPARLAEEETEREVILRHVSLISKRPAEVLVYLCAALEMKSSEIATFIMEHGIVTSCAKAIKGVSEKYNIPLAELHNYIKADMIAEKDLKLETKDKDKVIDQIYHLKSRAKDRIKPKKKIKTLNEH